MPRLHTEQTLAGRGLVSTPLDAGQRLVCQGANSPRSCVCFTPLACVATGSCETFEGQAKALRADAGRCERAEVGHCGDFTFIELDGELGGLRLRWFERTGRLVGERNSTHFPAYCGGEAMTAYAGEVPDCAEAVRDEVLCGQPSKAVRSPLEDLLVRTKR